MLTLLLQLVAAHALVVVVAVASVRRLLGVAARAFRHDVGLALPAQRQHRLQQGRCNGGKAAVGRCQALEGKGKTGFTAATAAEATATCRAPPDGCLVD